MEIQFLDGIDRVDGIDIQLLDGTSPDPKVKWALGLIEQQMKQDAARANFINRAADGYTNDIGDEADTVAAGYDFAGFAGDGSEQDDEMLRNYIVRTKKVVDTAPAMVSSYQDPKQLSGMLGYVLDAWDTPQREDAIDRMAAEEQALMGAGLINANIAEDYNDDSEEDFTVVDNYDYNKISGLESQAWDENTTPDGYEWETVRGLNGTLAKTYKKVSGKAKADRKNKKLIRQGKTKKAKGGFFSGLKKAQGNANLTTEAKEIVAANPATLKTKRERRNKQKQLRKKSSKMVKAADNMKTINISISGLGSIADTDPEVEALMTGSDMEYMVSGIDPKESIRLYIQRTATVSANRPDLFDTPELQTATVNACNTLLSAWDNPALLNAVLAQMEQTGRIGSVDDSENAGPLGGKLRKLFRKIGRGIKKAVKAIGKGFKKLGKAIAKVAKKVWKFIVRFNPLTFLIRAGIMGVCRLNMFKIADKTYPGSLTKEEALKQGISAEEWEKSNKSYGHLKNAYTKIGGKESKLKSCLKKGHKKKWSGNEYPESKAEIEAAKNAAKNATDPEVQKDIDEDNANMKKIGAKEDKNLAVGYEKSEKVQVEVIENEKTTKAQTPLRETGEDKGKVVTNIPKGAKVLVDTKQGNNTWVAATYGKYTGWMLKSQLAGIDGDDAEAMLVYGLGTLYDEYGDVQGLGDPATGTAIASAMSTITAILSKIKKIFGVAKKVVDKVKQVKNVVKKATDTFKVVKKAKDTFQKVKSTVDQAKSVVNTAKGMVNNVKNTVNQVKSGVNQVKNVANTVTSKINNVKRAVTSKVNDVKNTVNNVKSTVSNVRNTVQSNINNVRNTVSNVRSNVQNAANNVRNTVNTVKSNVQNGVNTVRNTVNNVRSNVQSTARNVATAAATTAATAAAAATTATQAAATTAKQKIATVSPQTMQAATQAAAQTAATTNTSSSTTKWLVIGGVAVVALGGIFYYLNTKKK